MGAGAKDRAAAQDILASHGRDVRASLALLSAKQGDKAG